MTSTTYSDSKLKQGRSFFLWSLFTGRTTLIVYLSLLTFFCTVVAIFGMGLSLQMPSQADSIWEAASYFTIFFTETLAVIFIFIFSIKDFSYLHNKRKTDMFGALPASRRTIFFSKLAAIIAQCTLPVVLIMTFVAIMNGGTVESFLDIINFFGSTTDFEATNLWFEMLRVFVGLVTNAVFIGFLSVCCGKTADKVLSYIIINAAYPISALLVQVLPGSFIIGYNVEINDFFTCALAPYTAMSSINPAYWGGFTVVFGALSFFLLPRRKAMRAVAFRVQGSAYYHQGTG